MGLFDGVEALLNFFGSGAWLTWAIYFGLGWLFILACISLGMAMLEVRYAVAEVMQLRAQAEIERLTAQKGRK